MKAYLYSFRMTLIHLTSNSWLYLLRFTKYVRLVFGVVPFIALFRPKFTISTKENSDQTYAISNVAAKVKKKFKGTISKVRVWESNFVVVTKIVIEGAAKAESHIL